MQSQPPVQQQPLASTAGDGSQLKAKLQLSTEADYLKLLNLLKAEAQLIKSPVTQQDFVLDSANHDLWNAGLTVALRRAQNQSSSSSAEPQCSVVIKETIWEGFIDTRGGTLHAMEEQPPYYEIRESEEHVSFQVLQSMVRSARLTLQNCPSQSILSLLLKYPIAEDGIHCIGSFVNKRTVFLWNQQIELEIDDCLFPHGQGYFVRFPPEDPVIMQLFHYLQTHAINYIINLTSKTALFFHGLESIKSGAALPTSLLASNDGQAALMAPLSSNPPSLQSLQTNVMPTNSTIPSATTSVITTSASSPVNPPQKRKAAEDPDTAGRKDSGRSRRGRRSLVSQLMEVTSQKTIDAADTAVIDSGKTALIHGIRVPVEILNQMDLSQASPEQIPDIIQQYHKRKSCEASARYRRKKNAEMDNLRKKVSDLEALVQLWKSRCISLGWKDDGRNLPAQSDNDDDDTDNFTDGSDA